MELSKYEQETIITYNEAEKTASVYTHNKSLLAKLERLAQERPDDCKLEKTIHAGAAADFVIPKSWVKISPPRIVSAAQRAVLERARQKQAQHTR